MQKVYVKVLPKSCVKCFASSVDGCGIKDIGEIPSKRQYRHENCPLIKLTPYIIEGDKRWIDKTPVTIHNEEWSVRRVE